MNVYETCPSIENELFLIRKIKKEDAADLLKVYSDKKAVPIFNSDNCTGDFYVTTMEDMHRMIDFWELEYQRKCYVRWSIVDKNTHEVIGTIELFNRKAEDYFNECGLLRLDVRSDYEEEKYLRSILELITIPAYEWFACDMIATKAVLIATERIKALTVLGYVSSKEVINGHDGTTYGDYWERRITV